MKSPKLDLSLVLLKEAFSLSPPSLMNKSVPPMTRYTITPDLYRRMRITSTFHTSASISASYEPLTL